MSLSVQQNKTFIFFLHITFFVAKLLFSCYGISVKIFLKQCIYRNEMINFENRANCLSGRHIPYPFHYTDRTALFYQPAGLIAGKPWKECIDRDFCCFSGWLALQQTMKWSEKSSSTWTCADSANYILNIKTLLLCPSQTVPNPSSIWCSTKKSHLLRQYLRAVALSLCG